MSIIGESYEKDISALENKVEILLAACEAAYDRITNIMGPLGEHLDNPVPRQLREAIEKARVK